jgi:hypothetical protein
VRGARYGRAPARDGDERQGTQSAASYGHPRYRERATCVHDLERCEPPDDRPGSNSVPGCEARSREIQSSLAGRITAVKKKFCCVTTRRRYFWVLSGLRREVRTLATVSLSSCMASFGGSVLAMLGLPPRRLPTTDLLQTFGILAITLVPAPRLILAPTSFAQTGSRTEPAYSGRTVMGYRTLAGAHGRCFLPREARGECVTILLGRYKARIRR